MTTQTADPRTRPVGNERKKTEDKQITFRLAADLHSRLEAAAEGLSIDISPLLRMMIRKHLPEYERLAAENREREKRSSPDED
jgi:predicted DNA-binding protein